MRIRNIITSFIAVATMTFNAVPTMAQAKSAQQQPVASVKGIGKVMIAGGTQSIPNAIPTLYDKIVKTKTTVFPGLPAVDTYDIGIWEFYLGDKIQFYMAPSYYAKVGCIYIPTTSSIKIKVAPNKYITPDATVADVFKNTGKAKIGAATAYGYYGNDFICLCLKTDPNNKNIYGDSVLFVTVKKDQLTAEAQKKFFEKSQYDDEIYYRGAGDEEFSLSDFIPDAKISSAYIVVYENPC